MTTDTDTTQTWTEARALYARTVKKHGKDSPQARAALANFRAVRLEDHVRGVLAAAPDISDNQRERICALLRAGAS